MPTSLSHTATRHEAKAGRVLRAHTPFRERLAELVGPHSDEAVRALGLEPSGLETRTEGRPTAVIEVEADLFSRQEGSGCAGPSAADASADPPKKKQPAKAPRSAPSPPTGEEEASPLTRNPRTLRYWRNRVRLAAAALATANHAADKQKLGRIIVPRAVYDLCADIFDDTRALAGVLEWIRERAGAAVLLEVEAACLYRVAGATQLDDWSCARARRKLAFLMLLLMSPWELTRRDVTGSTSDEPILVTCGFPQTGILRLLRSSQRQPYHVRTLQRDLAEIDECTNLLLRWRTPRAKAQPWECNGQSEGVVNRYCIRAGMVRDQWRRARNAAQSLIKATRLRFASWLVWTPPPRRGQAVPAFDPTPG